MAPRRTDTFRTLASLSRVELLHLLQVRGGRTLAELVDETGLHPNTIREHLQRLEQRGYVTLETEVRTTRGRPRRLYSASTGEDPETNRVFHDMVAAAAERGDFLRRYLARDGEAIDSELGEQALHQIDALDEHLDQSGFDAWIDEGDLSVTLAECPYSDMVEESHGKVCEVHLGIIRTVLSQAGGPIGARQLLPFSGDGQCTLHLESTD